jgi:hypothetical protein
MWNWLRRKGERGQTPLTGAPAVRRLKTYSAGSGYVYQYYFDGSRAAERNRLAGMEYVFQVSATRRDYFPVSIFLPARSVSGWQDESGRWLSDTERYAVAKMALLAAFDARENPAGMAADVIVTAADAEAILADLDL